MAKWVPTCPVQTWVINTMPYKNVSTRASNIHAAVCNLPRQGPPNMHLNTKKGSHHSCISTGGFHKECSSAIILQHCYVHFMVVEHCWNLHTMGYQETKYFSGQRTDLHLVRDCTCLNHPQPLAYCKQCARALTLVIDYCGFHSF